MIGMVRKCDLSKERYIAILGKVNVVYCPHNFSA